MGKNRKKQVGRADRKVGPEAGHEVDLTDIVNQFLEFQHTGEGFDRAWEGLEPIVTKFAGQTLAKLGVLNGYEVDPWAKDDVVSETVVKLKQLGEPGATGRFDPARAQPGISGLKGWLWRVVESHAVNWVRDHRCARSLKITTESDLVCNVLPSGDESKSFFDRLVAKIDRPDFLPLLDACIDRLPKNLARLVRLRLDEGLSHRDTEKVTGISAPVVGRKLKEAYGMLRGWLEEAGFDEAWLAA